MTNYKYTNDQVLKCLNDSTPSSGVKVAKALQVLTGEPCNKSTALKRLKQLEAEGLAERADKGWIKVKPVEKLSKPKVEPIEPKKFPEPPQPKIIYEMAAKVIAESTVFTEITEAESEPKYAEYHANMCEKLLDFVVAQLGYDITLTAENPFEYRDKYGDGNVASEGTDIEARNIDGYLHMIRSLAEAKMYLDARRRKIDRLQAQK